MIVVFTAGDEIGCTFLNWSFHWLSGDNYSWGHKVKSWVKLPENPLTEHNAHLFQKNYCESLNEWREAINEFLSFDINKKDFVFFGGGWGGYHVSKVNFVLEKKIKVIFLGCDHSRYKILERTKDSVNHPIDKRYKKLIENIKKRYSTVPKLSFLISTPSKTRDFLSLSMKYLVVPSELQMVEKENFNSDKNFFFVNLRDLLIDGENCLKKMFKFLDREIDQKRLSQWLPVHDQWKKMLLPSLEFYDDLPVILSSIVNGVSFSLKKYKLDIFAEAIIQHELMKQYHDRLLVSQMDRFPDNTKNLTSYLKRNTQKKI